MVKRITLIIFLVILIIFSIYKQKLVNIEGKWSVIELIYKGDNLYPKIATININSMNDSFYFYGNKKVIIKGNISIEKDKNKNLLINISSKEEYLNDNFNVEIDTLKNSYSNSSSIIIDLKLNSNKTYLHLQKLIYPRTQNKTVNIPRRGMP